MIRGVQCDALAPAARRASCPSARRAPLVEYRLERMGWVVRQLASMPFLAPSLEHAEHRLRDSVLIENGGIRRSIRTERALLTWHGPRTRGELYDLTADPDCLVNLWDEPGAANLQSSLLDELIYLMAANMDPLPVKEGPW